MVTKKIQTSKKKIVKNTKLKKVNLKLALKLPVKNKKPKIKTPTPKTKLLKIVKKQVVKLVKKITKKNPKVKVLKKKLPLKKVKAKLKVSKKISKVVVKKLDSKKEGIRLTRAHANPIIEPRLYSWESKATFNPAAFILNDTVHIVYRAIGDEDISVLGYASSYNGYHIQDRPTHLVYRRFLSYFKTGDPINYSSGGGWSGGCEDPRITVIDGSIYMLFNAFDGWGSLRVGVTSMKLEDFNKRKWNWSETILVSKEGERHKNWVLFPEKIKGKFAILHNLHTDDPSRIRIEYLDSLEEKDFKNANFESPDPNALPNKLISWHTRMRSVGPPPIKTDLGWLILYHATDEKESSRYKLGAMITDINDPTKVLYRSKGPILEPDEHYENNGWKPGIVYSCGAVVKDGRLFVYYGGADKFVCVASIKLSELVDHLKNHKVIKLKSNDLLNKKII